MKYYFAAEISKKLAQEVEGTIDRMRQAASPEEHREEGAELILRLTEACLDAYFLRPVHTLKVGLLSEKATAFGVKAAHRAIGLFVHRIAGSLSGAQVLTLADIIEGMLLTRQGDRKKGGSGS